jgi:hypothetical protein
MGSPVGFQPQKTERRNGLATIFFTTTDTTITGMKNDRVLEMERNMQILGLV